MSKLKDTVFGSAILTVVIGVLVVLSHIFLGHSTYKHNYEKEKEKNSVLQKSFDSLFYELYSTKTDLMRFEMAFDFLRQSDSVSAQKLDHIYQTQTQ